MEDWGERLADAVREARASGNQTHREQRMAALRVWLHDRNLDRVTQIADPSHVVELMELINRWRDEDVAKQPCAAPAPPANPFIYEQLERRIRIETIDDITINDVTKAEIDIEVKADRYRPKDLRTLAKQLTDLADAHEAIYPPKRDTEACAKAC